MIKKLTPKQWRAIESLLICGDVTQAAQEAGVSRTQLYKWLKEDAFKSELEKGTHAAIENLSRSLVSLGKKAAGVLQAALDDPSTQPIAKVRAADIVLNRILQLRELVDIDRRLAALEDKFKNEEAV